ncbi:unnamed protein product, partial [Penicillium nalgiovense]
PNSRSRLVHSLGSQVEFKTDYPVPIPGRNEVLAKVLYTGVCQSDLHTKSGTAAGPDGNPIRKIKLPHVGGHEGIGRVVALGPDITHAAGLKFGGLVGIRFTSRMMTWALVIGVDAGPGKGDFIKGLGAQEFIDFATEDPIKRVQEITGLGAHAAVVTAGSAKAFANACDMLRVGGTLSCVGIPPGRPRVETPICTIVIKGLRITGNLVGSLKECMEAVDMVRRGIVKPVVKVRPFKDLPRVYEEMEKGDISGRIVLQITA